MDFIEEVKVWVTKARAADPTFQVFGADHHKYQFSAPASLEEVRAFEQKYGLKLPEHYVRVLTELGSGAGPYYGLYSLKNIGENYTEHRGSDETFLNASLTPEIWKQTMLRLDEMEDDAEYDEMMRKIVANSVIIGTQGCTYDTLLMCGGSETGKMVNIDWNLEPDYPPIFTHMTFEEWYLGFFKEVAAKNKISGYGYTRLGTEDELITAYGNATQLEPDARTQERKEILSSLGRFRTLSSDTVRRLSENPDEAVIASLISLILGSDADTGLAMFEERFFGDHPETVIPMCRRIPDGIKDRYYKRALEILYTPEISTRLIPAIVSSKDQEPCAEKLLFFLNDCPQRSAKDIIPYAKSEQNPDHCRTRAAYVICECPDVSQYQDDVAELMCGGVRDVAFNAMQGAIRANLREPVILDAFRWMQTHYQGDSMIQCNLKQVNLE